VTFVDCPTCDSANGVLADQKASRPSASKIAEPA
jgi:hypothetical protein